MFIDCWYIIKHLAYTLSEVILEIYNLSMFCSKITKILPKKLLACLYEWNCFYAIFTAEPYFRW